jgi:hypothetical protein
MSEQRAQLPAVIRLIPFEQITLDCTQEEWTIKGVTPREGLGVMWGPTQTYKSFIELDQDMHIALGWKYRGGRVQQGPVIYCAFEGGRGVMTALPASRPRRGCAVLPSTDAPQHAQAGARIDCRHRGAWRNPGQDQPRYVEPLNGRQRKRCRGYERLSGSSR